LKENVSATTGILSMDMFSILKNTGKEERHTTAVFMLRDPLVVSELEVDYYGRLEEVVELQYHNEQNIVFLFKCYWYDTTDRGIRVDPHYGLVEINSKARLRNINDVFVFAKQCQQVYYTYTPSFRKDRSRVDWLSVLKTKPRGRVEVV
jgi:hypothetical protein